MTTAPRRTLAALCALTAHDLRRLAVEAEADPRTVARVAAGERARGMVDARIRRALEARGLTPPDAR